MYEDLPRVDAIIGDMLSKPFRLVSFYDFSYHEDCLSWANALFWNEGFSE
jgi:hypothetical protein